MGSDTGMNVHLELCSIANLSCPQPYFIAAIFSFGTATAKDIQTVLITRFFTGLFGSAPVTNTGGVMADIWPPEQRGIAIVGYAITIVGGPTLAPIIGGALASSSQLRWRWTEYLTGIIMMVQLVLDVFFLDESYPPLLLAYKARRLRFEGKNFALHAKVGSCPDFISTLMGSNAA
jgi:MFS family permease